MKTVSIKVCGDSVYVSLCVVGLEPTFSAVISCSDLHHGVSKTGKISRQRSDSFWRNYFCDWILSHLYSGCYSQSSNEDRVSSSDFQGHRTTSGKAGQADNYWPDVEWKIWRNLIRAVLQIIEDKGILTMHQVPFSSLLNFKVTWCSNTRKQRAYRTNQGADYEKLAGPLQHSTRR